MTQEEKELLFKDLCTRLPYGVKCGIFDKKIGFGGFEGKYPFILDGITIEVGGVDVWLEKANFSLETIKPYLRPMSSMTDEEISSLSEYSHCNISFNRENIKNSICLLDGAALVDNVKALDWLNKNHFDFRGLIEKGLALEAPEDMYK